MGLQCSDAVRNAILDAIETTVGASAKLQLRTGTEPANCAAANAGTLVAEIACPADWMANASGASKAKSGTWSATAANSGTITHFRLFDSADGTCHLQGTCSLTGGGGDLVLDAVAVTAGQTITINAFTIAAQNG